jgi:hypothetical protein
MSGAQGTSLPVQPVQGREERAWLSPRARRLIAATGFSVILVAFAAAPAALGAGQQVNHFRDIATDSDPDFCGTGQRIDIAINVRVNEWLAPHRADYKSTVSGKITLTNPLTGNVVIQRLAGLSLVVTVAGDPAGLNTREFITKGLPELFKTPHGGVLTRDAGYIVFRGEFDGDTPLSFETVVSKGPHPQADSDFELFCQIVPGALGL